MPSASNSNLSVDQLISLLEERLDVSNVDLTGISAQIQGREWARRLKEVTSTLDSHLNAVQPVNCLPNEVLSQIFLHMQSHNPAFQLPPVRRPDRSTNPNVWLPATRVCKTWRSVALATKLLWTCIRNRGRDPGTLATTFFHRSAPLFVRVELNSDDMRGLKGDQRRSLRDFYETLFEHQDRIEGLHVDGGCSPTVWSILSGKPPNILDLDLFLTAYTPEFDKILPSGLSTLRRLRLRSFNFLHKLFSLTNQARSIESKLTSLTHLYLNKGEGLEFSVQFVSKMEIFLMMLSSLSHSLQVLSLHDGSPFTRKLDECPLREPPIAMLQLRHIEIIISTQPAAESSDSDSDSEGSDFESLAGTREDPENNNPTGVLFTHSLTLPSKEFNLVWSSNHPFKLSDTLGFSNTIPPGSLTLPPPSLHEGVTRIICAPLRSGVHALVNRDTLYFDRRAYTFSFSEPLAFLADKLPNITTVHLCQTQYRHIRSSLQDFRRLEDLHIVWDVDTERIFLDLEDKVTNNSGAAIQANSYPNLHTLTIHSHFSNINQEYISNRMKDLGVEPLSSEGTLTEGELHASIRKKSIRYAGPSTYTLRIFSTRIDSEVIRAAQAIQIV